MTDGNALLGAIQAAPEDDIARLVYSDWLQERCGPGDVAQAAFIRAQVNFPVWFNQSGSASVPEPHPEEYLRALDWLDRGPADDALAAVVEGYTTRSRGEPPWYRQAVYGPDEAPFRVLWQRGFIAWVACSGEEWMAYGDALRAAHPVTAVQLTSLPLSVHRHEGELKAAGLVGRREHKGFPQNASRRDLTAALLKLEWPGVDFDLPHG